MSKRLFIHFPRPLRALAVLLACAGSAAHAATASGDPLTLSEALAIALLKNPSLQAYAFESRVAEARVLQAGIRPNPELAVGVENFLGTGALSGVKGLETTLQLSQIIDLGGSLTRRVETSASAPAKPPVKPFKPRLSCLKNLFLSPSAIAGSS